MPKPADEGLSPYNPLDKRHLGESVAEAVLRRPISLLPPPPFQGAGVYAIYYNGDFAPYAPLSSLNQSSWKRPIYVGKAVPAGARKGGLGLDADPGKALCTRLEDHAESIEQSRNLDIRHFRCRFLLVDDIWIPLGESLLIETFNPLWNRVVDGFGNHDPGRGRHQGQRPPWDVIHPGRKWAARLQPNKKSASEILAEVARFLEQ